MTTTTETFSVVLPTNGLLTTLTGFNPATDKLDLGGYSAHNLIVEDTAAGVAFTDPWSGRTVLVEGVSLGQLTIDSFTPIENHHLRMDVSGALAWEQGPMTEAHTVYARSHEVGQVDRVAFDPATDVVDFRYYGSREQLFMMDSDEGVVIGNSATGQTLVLLGVEVADLSAENFLFTASQAREDHIWSQLGLSALPDSQIITGDHMAMAGTTATPTGAGSGAAPSGDMGGTTVIEWKYGTHTLVDFNPATDTINFMYFHQAEFSVAEVDGSVVITIAGMNQTYTLSGVSLADLDYANIQTLDQETFRTWVALLDGDGGTPTSPTPAQPTLSVSAAQVSEGDGGTADLTFQVTLSAASDTAVTVDYATHDGTATAGSDYTAKSGTLVFAPGETTAQVTVSVSGDTTVEADERLTLALSNASGASLATAQATGTIMNDDETTGGAASNAVSFSVRDDWTSGFIGTMTLTAQAALDGWTIAFDAPFDISNIWNAEIVSHVGDHYVIRNAAWNGDVAADGTVSFGFQASPGGATASVSDFIVNGTPIDGTDPEPVLPSLSITDAQVSEGDDGTSYLVFTVSLSAAAEDAVSVQFATGDGSATAGADYAAQSGTLTFAAGETAKTIRVAVHGDGLVEGNETLSVTLSAASGATLADASATGTIINDDVAAPAELPIVSVANTTVLEGNPGTGSGDAADGWFSTSGNQIVDSDGNSVKIAGVNWFGFEGSNNSPNGLWTRGYQDMMDQMKDLGFNTIRLPFSTDMLHATTASGIDYSKNPDLQGLTPLQIMDKIVEYADEIGLKIILDHHRSSTGAGTSENGLWYDSTHSEAQWVSDWQMLAERYADNSAVIGADLHNEPYNGTWGGGGATDWAAAAERAGNAIGEVNSNWLIFVEGVGTYNGESYWWGGNLMGVRDRPIELDVDNKLVYSAHDYGNSVYAQSWFQSSDFAEDLTEKFREAWGYIYEENIAPVYIGEFGTKLEDPKDAPWLEALTSYMSGDFDNDGTIDIPAGDEGISWTYWSWNPNSGDTGGILADDWRTVHTEKLAYLEPIQFDLGDGSGDGDVGGGDANAASFVVSLSEAASESVTVDYHTVAGSADASDFTATSGTITFAAGETTKIISIPVTADTSVEGNEHFSLVLTDASGAVIGVAEGVATIVDDDSATTTLPSLSIADARANEGDAGAGGTLAFTVALSAAAESDITVSYSTASGTATSGTDFTGMDGTFTIAAGETHATITVPVIGDSTVEANETFSVVLTGATGATIADGSATGTIVNDDVAASTGDQLDFTVVNDWGSGFIGNMTLTPQADLDGWTVAFDADFEISNIWNAEIVSHVGDHYVIRNASYNADVNADSAVTFGFQASPGGSDAVASGLTVNGASVGGASQQANAALSLADDVLLTAALTHISTSDTAFTADVTLHNGADTAATDWSVEIDTPYTITGVTGAEILSHTADGYILGGTGAIAANDDVTVSISGAGRFDASHFGVLV